MNIYDKKLNYRKIGNRVRMARENLGISQKELAGMSHCSASCISHLENGDKSVSMVLLYRISLALHRDMNYLMMDQPGLIAKIKIEKKLLPLLDEVDAAALGDMIEALELLLKVKICYDEKSKL